MRTQGVVLALAAATAGVLLVTPALGTPGTPASMAALGSAISAGACTDASCADRPQNSWSTGTNPAVASHRRRLAALLQGSPVSDRLPVHAYTFASGRFKTVADLEPQARLAATHRVRYVTADLGVGDLCGGTPLATFRAELIRAIAAYQGPASHRGGPAEFDGKMLVVSVEDLVHHWQVIRADPVASRTLKAGRHLDCGLGYSVAQTRLDQIRRRTIALNEIVARVCFRLGCLYDTGLRFRMPLRASYFSSADPRYLSIEGQRALAAVEWRPALVLMSSIS